MKRMIVLFAVLALVFPTVLAGQTAVYFDSSNPPFMYEANKSPAGLYPTLFAEVFKRMNMKADIQTVPWKRALAGCDAGTNGVGGIYKNAEREAKWDFSEPFYEERLAIYVLNVKEINFQKIEDLYGKKIGVIRGWSYGDEFDAAVASGKIIKEETDSDATNFKKLSSVRLDAVIAIWESGDKEIAAQGLEKAVKRLPELLVTNKVYLTFNKTAKLKETLAKFNTTINAMKKDGSFDKIVKSVFGK